MKRKHLNSRTLYTQDGIRDGSGEDSRYLLSANQQHTQSCQNQPGMHGFEFVGEGACHC